MSIQEFKSKVNGIMDVIWAGGLTNHTAVIELMIYIIFLRELHKHDQEQKMLDKKYEPVLSGDLSIYQWDNILSLNADALFVHLGDAFEKLSQQSNNQTVKLLYNKAHVKLFARPALRTVVHKIEELMKEIENEEKIDRSDMFGDLYEYLLSSISSAGTGGQFRTPRHIIKFMVDVIDPEVEESICDPACGTGGFLVAALEHLKRKYTSEDFKKEGKYPMDNLTEKQRKFLYNQAFTGFDSDPDMIKFGLMNLYFHKLENATVKRRNSLVDTQGETTKWDIILANPPFAGKIDRDSVAEELQMETGATEVLFLNYMIRHLSDRGRCAVIVPEGVIFQGAKAHKAIREKLVNDAGLWAVASLPSGVFNPYAGVKTSILFFDKTKKETNSEIALIKISNDGFDLGAQRRPHDKNDLPRATEILKAWRNGEKIESPIAFYVEKEKIVENGDYNLSGDRYRVATDYSNAKWPMVKLGDICDVYQPKTITSKEIKKVGEYRVFGANGVIGYFNEYNHVDAEVAVTCRGATCGTVNFTEPKSWITGNAMVVKPKAKNVNKLYLFYILREADLSSVISGAAQPQITRQALSPFKIPLPPLEIQEQIVAELGGYQNIISGAKQIVQNWKPKIEIDPEWERVKLGEVCEQLFAGGDVPRDSYSLEKNEKHQIPIYTNGINEKSLYGFTDVIRVKKESVTISARGTIGYSEVRQAPFYPAVRLIVATPDLKKIDVRFLKYSINALDIYSNGNSIPQLTIPMVSNEEIPLPSLAIQKKIVEKIEAERALVESAKKLIEIYEQKIKEVIGKLWEK